MKIILFLAFVMAACSPTKTKNTNCIGEAKKDCVCTMQYDPVCGCDKKTYSNACSAECAGVATFTKGECPSQ